MRVCLRAGELVPTSGSQQTAVTRHPIWDKVVGILAARVDSPRAVCRPVFLRKPICILVLDFEDELPFKRRNLSRFEPRRLKYGVGVDGSTVSEKVKGRL